MEFKISDVIRSKDNQGRLSAGNNDEGTQKKQDEKSSIVSSLRNRVEILVGKEKLLIRLEEELDDKAISCLSKKLENNLSNETNKSAPSKPITSSTQTNAKYFEDLEKNTIKKIKEWTKNKKNKQPFELYLNLHLGDIKPQHWIAGKIVFEKDGQGDICRITTISLDSCYSVDEDCPRVKSAKNLLEKISRSIFPDINTNFEQGIKKELQNSGTKSCGYYMIDLKYKAAESKDLILDGKFKKEIEKLKLGYLDSNNSKALLFVNHSIDCFDICTDEPAHTYNDEDYKRKQFESQNKKSKNKITEEKTIEKTNIDLLQKKTGNIEKTSKPKLESNQEILQEKTNLRKQVAEKLPNINEEEKTKFIESFKIPESVEKDELKYYPRSAIKPNQKTCEMDCSIVYDEKNKNIKYIQMCGNNEPINKPFRIQMQKGESASDIILQIQKEGLSPFKDKITILRAEEGPNVSDLQIKQIITHIDSLRKENAHQTVQKI